MNDESFHYPADWWKDDELRAEDSLNEIYDILGMIVEGAPVTLLKKMRGDFSRMGFTEADALVAKIDRELLRRAESEGTSKPPWTGH